MTVSNDSRDALTVCMWIGIEVVDALRCLIKRSGQSPLAPISICRVHALKFGHFQLSNQ